MKIEIEWRWRCAEVGRWVYKGRRYVGRKFEEGFKVLVYGISNSDIEHNQGVLLGVDYI